MKSPTNKTVGFQLTDYTDPYDPNYKVNLDIGWNFLNREGAGLGLANVDAVHHPGGFTLYARDANNYVSFQGTPDGKLIWDGNNVITTKRTYPTVQYVTNTIVTQSQFNRCSFQIYQNLLVAMINMSPEANKTTGDIIFIGKIKNVNMVIPYDIEVVNTQNAAYKSWLLCLYNNGSDIDIGVYCSSTTDGGRLGHVFVIPII